jgi:hypothetical protein
MEWERGLRPQEGTAIRAEVQFFAPVGKTGGAVMVCAVASAVLERSKNCWKELHDEKSSTIYFFQTQLFLSNGRTDSGKEGGPSSIMEDDSCRIWKKTVSGEWLFWRVCDSGKVLINLYSTSPDMCRGEAPESVPCVTSKGASGFQTYRGGKPEI